MKGRIEADMKYKYKIERMLNEQPEIVWQYVDSLSQNAWSTKLNYANVVLVFFRWVRNRKAVSEITPEILETLLPLDINAYMTDMQYIKDASGNIRESSSSRQMKTWSALNSFFDFMLVNGFVKENIVRKTKRPKNKDNSSCEYLTQSQMKQLIKKVEDTKIQGDRGKDIKLRDLLVIRLFLTTGIRVEPLREINIEDIDFKKKTVMTIQKGNLTHEYKLTDSVMETIAIWLPERARIMGVDEENQTGALLVSVNKTRLSYWSINKAVKRYTSQIGIEGGYSCHKLRHSYGTAVYMMTKDIYYTKEKMGHADISTTQRYINEVDSELDEVVNNKLDEIVSF